MEVTAVGMVEEEEDMVEDMVAVCRHEP